MKKLHQNCRKLFYFLAKKEKRQQENEVRSDPNIFCRTPTVLVQAVYDAIGAFGACCWYGATP